MKKLFLAIIKFYKKHISRSLRTNCVFKPTCSVYAMQALKKHNFIKASALIVFRLLRCNSLSKGGFDPVPDNKKVLKWLF